MRKFKDRLLSNNNVMLTGGLTCGVLTTADSFNEGFFVITTFTLLLVGLTAIAHFFENKK